MAEKSESKKSAAAEPKEEGRSATERTRAVDAAILTIEKQFGRGAIVHVEHFADGVAVARVRIRLDDLDLRHGFEIRPGGFPPERCGFMSVIR